MQTANVLQHIRALERVPPELWLRIFESTTPVPSNYQFDLERAACALVNEDYQLEHNLTTKLEEYQAIKCRLAVVQVCKYWYEAGIQALWSHLSLRSTNKIIEILDGVRDTIERRPALAASVIQVSLQNESLITLGKRGPISSHLENIIPRLISLKIIICPPVYGCCIARPSLDVAVLHQDFVTDNDPAMIDICNYFKAVRVLDVDMSMSMRDPARAVPDGDILFPRLEGLAISTPNHRTIKCITSQWQIPRLQRLSICSPLPSQWKAFIEKCGSTLQVLELRFVGKSIINGLDIHMPVLKELHISDCRSIFLQITAPRLERFYMFNVGALWNTILQEHLSQVVMDAQISFPSLRSIHLRSYRKQAVTDQDITSWREAGINVNIHLSLTQVRIF
jgi:hypothetical protein